MIAVTKKRFKSAKTDASLYNGRPTDTGSTCHSAGVASCTPSIQKDKNGVSVENVPTETKQWFVLRVSYGRIMKAKEMIDARNIERCVPIRYKQVTKQNKNRIVAEPLLSSFTFVYSSLDEVNALLHDDRINSHEAHPLLSFYFDHTSYRQDNTDRNPPLCIRDEDMQNFIKLASIKNPHIRPVTSENIQYKLGGNVIITEGDFKGVHVKVARLADQQRVIVELFSGCLVATAYIPKEAMEKTEK